MVQGLGFFVAPEHLKDQGFGVLVVVYSGQHRLAHYSFFSIFEVRFVGRLIFNVVL